jgi:NAD(P)-dependent dehydrogenase (short-subunit alcohol dehydrogenase family)
MTNKMNKIILIFGFGPRLGAGIARAFANKGYKVAVVSRTNKAIEPGDGYLWIQADMSDAFSVEGVFTTVRNKLGIPSVVVYNGKNIFDYNTERLF